MIANYHTHTYRCHHADGTEREYVERAIENGLKIFGFSETRVRAGGCFADDGLDIQTALFQGAERSEGITVGAEGTGDCIPDHWRVTPSSVRI